MKRHRHWLAALLIPAFLLACESNPTTPADDDDDHVEELTAELTLSSDHVHTLSEVTFEVTVKDGHGAVVTDLESVTVERLLHDTQEWRGTELALSGQTWTAPYTFASSGEYELRVSVVRHGAIAPEVVYEMAEHMEVNRAHVEIDGMRVEFETFPGHIHEGETAQMMFWILEPEEDEHGHRHGMEGLHVTITCEEESGLTEEHHATEVEPGVYMAEHAFTTPGEFQAGIHIGEHGGHVSQADFHTHVAHGH